MHNFEVGGYLESRNCDDFVQIEIGHRLTPILPYQKPFTGSRAYIGIEANLRNPYGMFDKDMQDIKNAHQEQNVFFVEHNTGGQAVFVDEGVSREYEGEYDAETFLPDDAADEVFLGNVFGDYHIAWHSNTQKLLKECSRLIDKNGMIVIRETITPQNVQISDEMLAIEGLTLAKRLTTEDEQWEEMEDVFAGTNFRIPNPNSFYLMLQKED